MTELLTDLYSEDEIQALIVLDELASPLDSPNSFDAVVSIDTIFFGRHMAATIAELKRIPKSGGRMAIFNGDYQNKELLKALGENGLTYQIHDFSEDHIEHMLLKHRIASQMREAFE